MGFQYFSPDGPPHGLRLDLSRIDHGREASGLGTAPARRDVPRRPRTARRAQARTDSANASPPNASEDTLVYAISGEDGADSSIRVRFDEAERRLLVDRRRHVTDPAESALLDGLIALSGREPDEPAHAAALPRFEQARRLADGEWLAGMLHLRAGDYRAAEGRFRSALDRADELGLTFKKIGIEAIARIPISDRVSAHATPQERGALLGLIGVYHHADRPRDALDRLKDLLALSPADPVVRLYFVELLWRSQPATTATMRRLVDLTADIENDSPVSTAILLYRARALSQLRLYQTAIQTLTNGLRRPKGRPADLLREIHLERAMTHAAKGNKSGAIADLKRLLARSPDFTKARSALHTIETS